MTTILKCILIIISILPIGSTLVIAQSSDELLFETQLSFKPFSISWSPDGELISIGHTNGVQIFDASLELITSLPGDSIIGQSWNSDGTVFVTGGGFKVDQGTVQVWNRDLQNNTFTLNHTFTNSYLDIVSAELSPNNQYLATLSRSLMFEAEVITYTVEIWDTNSWSLLTTLRNQYSDIYYPILVWSLDSSRIAGSGRGFLEDGNRDSTSGVEGIYIADITSGERIIFIDTEFIPSSMSWSSKDEIAVDLPDLNVYDPHTGNFLRTLRSSRGGIQFSPDGNVIVGFLGGYIDLVSVVDGSLIHGFESEPDIRAIEWSPDGQSFIAMTEDGMVQIWDASAYVELSDSNITANDTSGFINNVDTNSITNDP